MKPAILLVCMLLVITTARGQETQRIGLRLILVSSEAEASAVRARIANGESFAELARQLSKDPSAANGGLLGVFDPSDLRSELRIALAEVSPGHVSAIVKLNTGFAVLYKLTVDETKRLIDEAEDAARKRRLYGPLLEAAMKGDGATLRGLLAEKADVNTEGDDGRTALHGAAFAGQVDMIDLLSKHGANVNASDRLGVTPLHLAVGSAGATASLLSKGARVNAKNASGCTPLSLAAEKSA